MVRLVLILVFAFLVYAGMRYALRKKQLSVNQFFAIYFFTMVGIALLYLGVTGRLHPVFAVLGAVLPFLSRIIGVVMQGAQMAAFLRLLRGVGLGGASAGSGANAPAASEIRSRYIHMVLHHDTGFMDGTVLEGQFKDAKLSQLELAQLAALLNEIRDDIDSCNLLVAYLDREHEGWQESTGEQQTYTGETSSGMTESEALDILGLEDDATADDIIMAHKRMMQKVHPDRGGSTYLATKINAAKDFLMEKRG